MASPVRRTRTMVAATPDNSGDFHRRVARLRAVPPFTALNPRTTRTNDHGVVALSRATKGQQLHDRCDWGRRGTKGSGAEVRSGIAGAFGSCGRPATPGRCTDARSPGAAAYGSPPGRRQTGAGCPRL